jgi:hypothetical protein
MACQCAEFSGGSIMSWRSSLFAVSAAIIFAASTGNAVAQEEADTPQPGGPPPVVGQAAGGLGIGFFGAAIAGATGAHTATSGIGLLASQRLGVGQYEVIFRRNISLCVYVATVGDRDAGVSPPGIAVTDLRAGEPRGVFVSTYSIVGGALTPTDRDFQILITCAR